MTVLLVVALALLVVLIAIAFVSLGRPAALQPRSNSVDEEWLRNARDVMRGADAISESMTASEEQAVVELPDHTVTELASETARLRDQIAALSRAAPTAMDSRVCRVLGVRAEAINAMLLRELDRRERPGIDEDRPRPEFPSESEQRLREFRQALDDLRDDVELL